MNQLPLHPQHLALTPRMGEFAGWEMSLFYSSAAHEHTAVREHAGIFDISHMGQVFVKGAEAEAFLNSLFTNDVTKLKEGRSHYSFLLNDEGGVIDDLLLYRLAEKEFFIIFNGARAEEAVSILKDSCPANVEIDWRKEVIGLAIQGPAVAKLAPELIGTKIPAKRNNIIQSAPIIATTGYTGEHGFEWFGNITEGKKLWEKAMQLRITPCGLVARDSLRLEAGLPLNGQDLARDKSPLAAGLKFAVKLNKEVTFRGKEALLNNALSDQTLIAFTSSGPIPRTGYDIVNEAEEKIGEVSSGGRPPHYANTIGLAWVKNEFTSTNLDMMIRGKKFPIKTTKLPFQKK